MVFRRLQFSTIISAGSGGGYRVWIPRKVTKEIPDSIWIIESAIVHKGTFKQTLVNHPYSKAGGGKRYIPIYCEDIQNVDYLALGDVNVEICFED